MPRTATFHLPIANLDLPGPISVGPTTFHPAGWLAEYVPKSAHDQATSLVPFAREDIAKSASASIRMPWPDGPTAIRQTGESARELVRDSIAVLRLYQVERNPRYYTGDQTFGYASEITGAVEYQWITRGREIVGAAVSHHGTRGGWKFREDDIEVFHAEPVFAYLHRALKKRGLGTSFQERSLNAVRMLSLAALERNAALQVVHYATAVEALYGDDPRPDGNYQGGYFRACQRVAFVWCGMPGSPHVEREVCPFLSAVRRKALDSDLAQREARRQPSGCDWFAAAHDLFADRHEALHRARRDFPRAVVGRRRGDAVEIVLAGLSWIAKNKGRTLADLNGALARYLRSGPGRAPVPASPATTTKET